MKYFELIVYDRKNWYNIYLLIIYSIFFAFCYFWN